MKGQLWKKSPNRLRFMAAWDLRHVTLIRGRLSWINEQTGEVSGYVDLPLNNCTVEAILGSATQFGLHVQGGKGSFTTLEAGARTFIFDAEDSPYTRFEWMAGIKEHMKVKLDDDPDAWAKEILSNGTLTLLSGKWLFMQDGGVQALANRQEDLPPEAFVAP